MERGSYQELLSAVTLERYRRRPVECFLNVGETPQRTGGGDVLRVLIFGTDRTSLHPPLHTHTHTLTPPQLSYSRVEEESGIYSNSQIIITQRADSRLWGGG